MKRRATVWFLVVVALASVAACKRRRKEPVGARLSPPPAPSAPAAPAAEPAPSGPALDERATVSLGIYYLPKAKGDARAVLERVLRTKYAYLKIAGPDHDSLPDPPFAFIYQPAMTDYAPPSLRSLEHFGRGLSDQDAQAVQKSEQVLALDVVGAGADRLKVLRDGQAIMLAVADETGGLLWDENTRELYSRDAWRERMGRWKGDVPVASTLFTIHSYRDGELLRMVTVGLGRFGLPDLVVNRVSSGTSKPMATLINLTAQTLLQGGQVRDGGKLEVDVERVPNDIELGEGARGKGTVVLAIGQKEEGDADNRLWEIVFPGKTTDGEQARQEQFVTALLGSTDHLSMVKHDEEVEAASRRAREKLIKEKKPLYQHGPRELENLLVKAPFKTPDGGDEWMWIEVTAWEGKTIKGLLASEPYFVKGLKAGDRVEALEDEIFDYIHVRADGTQEGNETEPLLMRSEERRIKMTPR
jgi:uncharacterized protein YegJ (DUF2314 family)